MMWARAELRRRRVSLVLLGVLVGVTAGVAIATMVGSVQSEGAYQELRRVTEAPDVTVFASQRSLLDPDWDALRELPEVERLGVWHLMFGQLDDEPFGVLFGASDGVYLQQMNRPVVVEGRMWDPQAPDEIVVSEGLAQDAPIGTEITWRSMTPADLEGGAPPFTGEPVTLRVVGVIRTINQYVFTYQAFVGPGYFSAYGDQIATLTNADLDLVDPARDMPVVLKAVNRHLQQGVPTFDLNEAARRVETTLGVEGTALFVLSIVIAVLGGLLVTQAVTRSVATVEDDAAALQAMGMTNLDIARATTLVHLVTLGVALVTTIGVAIGLSGVFPVGLGRDVYPDPGVGVAWRWLVPGVATLLVLGLAVIVITAYRATIRTAHRQVRSVPAVVRALERVPSVPVAVGATMAFDSGQGPRRTPVRAALVASTIGVAGVVGTLVVADGITHTLEHPERAGRVADVDVYPSETPSYDEPLDGEWVARVQAAAGQSARVAPFARIATSIDGVGAPAVVIRPFADGSPPDVALTVTDGRRPVAPGEVALGPKTAESVDAAVGDVVTIDDIGVQAHVVGIALFPPEVHAGFDEGVWMTPTDFDAAARIAASQAGDDIISEQWVGVVVGDDQRESDVAEAINAELADDESGQASVVEMPIELDNLATVRRHPFLLAAFLALLAVLSLSHVMATTVRRRRHDFAVLRALGLGRRPTRLILNAQSTAITLFGLIIGTPIGVVVGRGGWRWVADRLSVEYVAPAALLALAASVPIAMLLVNALAVWPGRRLARMRLAEQLRAE
jgi:ABC-type lipoprotein release transport system permease subunit